MNGTQFYFRYNLCILKTVLILIKMSALALANNKTF